MTWAATWTARFSPEVFVKVLASSQLQKRDEMSVS